MPQARFIWCVVLAGVLPFIVHVTLPNWLGRQALIYQLAGTLMAFWQLLDLRRTLKAAGLVSVFSDWLHAFPRWRAVTGIGHAELSIGVEAYGSASRRFGRDGLMEVQVSKMWEVIEEHEVSIGKLQSDMHRNATLSERALTKAREELQGLIRSEKGELVTAVTSGPLIAVFALYLVTLSTAIQLYLT